MTTANAIRSLRETLERLGKEATPGNLSTAEVKECLDVGNCPLCDGDGTAPYGVDTFTNFDGVAVGVQFFGVGNEHGAHQKLWEAYVNNHAQILSALRVAEVVQEIERALKKSADQIAFSLARLAELRGEPASAVKPSDISDEMVEAAHVIFMGSEDPEGREALRRAIAAAIAAGA